MRALDRIFNRGRIAQAIAKWVPSSLFKSGEPGAWYDPSDLTALFQDSAGTTPVTAVEQPVGLMLDKSKGLVLGPELVYTSNISGLPAGGGTQFYPVNMISLSAGKAYRITFTVSGYAGTGNVGLAGAAPAGVVQINCTGNGTYSCVQFPTASGGVIFFTSNTNTANFDNISVRELPGNHAFQSTWANRPVLSARVNLLTKTEDFSDAAWSKTAGATVITNTTIAPDGTLTADTISFSTGSDYLYQSIANYPAVTGQGLTLTYHSKITSRLVIFGGATPSGTDVHSYVDIGNGWYRHTTTRTFTTTTTALTAQVLPSPNIVGIGAYALWGLDLRPTNTGVNLPAYQRVNTSTDYDTTGFPLYLKCNGTNTSMQTNSIDFSSTDKMTVVTGVRKLSDAARGMLMELSNSGSTNLFNIEAPDANAAITYKLRSSGSTIRDLIASGYAAPITNVLTGISNISAPEATLRVNGSQVATTNQSQGTGTYGNYPLYLFARAGTSLFFNGNFYGAIIRGAQSSAQQIADAEKWMNKKTLAY
jgi:hypothetical protein